MTAPADLDPHVTALQVLLDTGLPAAVGVYVGGAPPDAVPPYVVLYPDAGTPEGTLGNRHRDLLIEFQVTAVGTSAQQAQAVASAARQVLLGAPPTVPGRVAQPLWQIAGGPRVTRDDDVTPPLFFLPVIYQLRSGPP